MADSTTNLDQLLSTQAGKEVTANALLDAASPATFGGRHASACSGLTWGYYGGKFNVSGTITAIANGTLALTASATNYIEVDSSGGVHVNTSGFTGGRTPLYTVVCGASTVTSWTDERLSAVGLSGGGGGGMSNPMTTAGDMIDGGVAGAAQRLPIGTTGQVLTVAAGAPTWATASSGGSAMPVNNQTGTSYHPVLADAPQASNYQGIVTMNNSGANTVTLDPHTTSAWTIGTTIEVIQLGAGQTAFVAGAGVTVQNPSSLTARVQYSTIFATYVAVDTWIIGGDLT